MKFSNQFLEHKHIFYPKSLTSEEQSKQENHFGQGDTKLDQRGFS